MNETNEPIEPESGPLSGLRLPILALAFFLLVEAASAVVRFTSTNDAAGTTWMQIVGIPTADRALCVNSSGQIGNCTISLATGLCTIGCTIP